MDLKDQILNHPNVITNEDILSMCLFLPSHCIVQYQELSKSKMHIFNQSNTNLTDKAVRPLITITICRSQELKFILLEGVKLLGQ